MAFHNDDISINSLLGVGSSISGNVKFTGFVTINGDIDGDLETTGKIIITEDARIRGNVTAKSAMIGGIVEGDILAPEGIQLFETATVIGDITTKHLQLADNVIFQGHCIALSNEEEYEEARQKWLDITTINSSSFLTQKGGASF